MKIIYLFIISLFLYSCSYYTFHSGSLPNHLNTVRIEFFTDNSNRYDLDLSENLQRKIVNKIEDYDILDVENSVDVDAVVMGTISKYEENLMARKDYDESDIRSLKIVVKFSFFDKISKKYICDKVVLSETEDYETVDINIKNEKLEKLLEKISDKIVVSMLSNW